MISEGKVLAQALELHFEFQDWENSGYEEAERHRSVNWRLPLQLDAVVLRRASDDACPTEGVIRELERRAESRSNANHKIAILIAEDLWQRMKEAVDAGDPSEATDAQYRFEVRNEELKVSVAAFVDSERG